MSDLGTEHADMDEPSNDIAIIGMACRLPGAKNPGDFWTNLKDGAEALTNLSDEELLKAGVPERELEDPNYVKAGMFLDDMECFDAKFFGFNPQEAKIMDPQHRHFLECAWETFEDAGYVPDKVDGAVGVFAGSGHNAYLPYNVLPNRELLQQIGFFLLRHTGNDKDFLSTRASYLFDLRGPSINVQTACSTSLVAVHQAGQSLLNGECDMALAGGVTIELPHKQGYLYKESEILSKDGHCRPFDASSGGTLFGSGVGCVLLKRLDDALADGDNIHGILKSSAINNDGSNKVSYLAPSVDGQAAAIREAIEIADIDPASVGFIECHGTGTQMGDPIEVAALTQAYGLDNPRKQYCALGSVKSNIGHLDTAAGIAGMIKAILSLKHGQLVPTLHFNAPNPAIDFPSSPFYVNERLRDWNSDEPRRAAVSSLGVGGTNAHVILEEPPTDEGTEDSKHGIHLLHLSANSERSLNDYAAKLADYLTKNPETDLADMCYTLSKGRKGFNHRITIPVKSVSEAIEALSDQIYLNKLKTDPVKGEPSLVFMLPGGGAQYSGMGVDLYHDQPVYREAFDACLACLPSDFSERVRALVFEAKEKRQEATKTLATPTLTLTSLFATEYALAKQMMAWGAIPDALLGHSMGENTAACLAGVMSLHDAMNLVYLRGQLFERAPEGGMLSIPMPLEEAREYMTDDLDVAAVNAPELCVATGPKDALMALKERLEKDDIESTIVRINVAAHSRMLDGILDEFRAYLNSIELSAPQIPFTSNLTGTWITDEQAMSADYWVDHLRNTVKFSENIEEITKENRVLVEIGPGRTLTNLAKANLAPGYPVMSSMRHPNEEELDTIVARSTLGNIWANGIELDWDEYWKDEYRFRLSLPTYAFERNRHWVDAPDSATLAQDEELRKKKDIADWYGKLSWKQSDMSGEALDADADYLIFANDQPLSQALITAYTGKCTVVKEGASYQATGENSYSLAPKSEKDFFKFSEECLESSSKLLKLFYLWPTVGETSASGARLVDQSFWGLFNLLKALAELDRQVELCVVSDCLQSLAGEAIAADASLALGPVLVAPRELPHVNARIVDIRSTSATADQCAKQLNRELSFESSDAQVCYRGKSRWIREIDSVSIANRAIDDKWLKEDACVLISGGLGGIGLNMARLLCQKGVGKVVLMSRREAPEQSSWDSLLEQLPETHPKYQQISSLKELSETGAQVVTIAADVTKSASMKSALESKGISIDQVSGVIHGAGTMDDKLLMEKTAPEAELVMSAKVNGAKALDELFASTDLDFFVAFSSVASYLGLPGQIDYTAANAYLDAFILERSMRCSGKSVVVNWSAWKEVGMAVNAGNDSHAELPLESSLLDSYHRVSDNEVIYSAKFDVESHWLVSEHKTREGFYLIPGTGFIELVRAAGAHYLADSLKDSKSLVISDLGFLSAFEVSPKASRMLHIAVSGDESDVSVSVYAEEEDFPMVTAQLSVTDETASSADFSTISAKCNESTPVANKMMDQVFMDFGPRWACIDGISVAGSEALVKCHLPDQYSADFDICSLHPAMLDMATGCAQFLSPGFDKEADFYVPVNYSNIKIFGPTPSDFYSYIRLLESAEHDRIGFDVTMLDAQGNVFLQVENYTMLKLDHGFASTLSDEEHEEAIQEEMTPEQERLAAILREAIKPPEGMEAFDRMMSAVDDDTQFIVASIDSALWQRQLRTQFKGPDEQQAEVDQGPVHDADADPDIPQIEAALVENAGVERAVVRSFLDDDGNRRIIAYYVPDDWEPVTVTELRNAMNEKLPSDLVPKQYVQVDEFVDNDDGSIEKSQLLDPFAPVDNYIAPRTHTEKGLAKIWQGVLGVQRVGLNENFFDIGGHSLLSIRVIVKVKKEFGVRLDQAKMVLMTLEQLAKDIDDHAGPTEAVESSDSNEAVSEAPASKEHEPTKEEGKPEKKGMLSSLFKKGR